MMMDSFKHPNLHFDPPALEYGLVQDPSDVPQVGRHGVHEWVFVNLITYTLVVTLPGLQGIKHGIRAANSKR